MENVPVGDFMMDLVWYITVLSFIILLIRRILPHKTIFDLLFRKRNEQLKKNVIYNNKSDKNESEFPSLFKEFNDLTFSVIIIIEDNYSLKNISEINDFFNNFAKSQESDSNFTFELIIVIINNFVKNSDFGFLLNYPNVRIIAINSCIERTTAVQIGSFAAKGRFIFCISSSNPIHDFYNFINSYKNYENKDFCIFLPVRDNCPGPTFLEKFLISYKLVDKINDFNFDSFILSRKAAKIILQNIHFSCQYSFNLEFLIISKLYRFQIIETRVNASFSKPKSDLKSKIKLIASVAGLVFGRVLDLFKYNFRLPILEVSNTNNSNIEL